MSGWSDEVVGRIGERFEAARDPVAAGPMVAYMKDQFPFFGIPTTPREVLLLSDVQRRR